MKIRLLWNVVEVLWQWDEDSPWTCRIHFGLEAGSKFIGVCWVTFVRLEGHATDTEGQKE